MMRLATAADEVLPLKDPRVQSNPAYLSIILLSRVIVSLGSMDGGQINPKTIEGLFVEDLAYLQDFYAKVNGDGTPLYAVVCPKCEHKFEAEPEPPEGP
jgi:phage FluMu protein gp41